MYLKKYSVVVENISYITILQLFSMLVPLITYPYLIRVLGAELYGWVVTAQVLASYCSLFIDYGFRKVSARHVSIHMNNKEKLSEILSSIHIVKFGLWIFALIIYLGVITAISSYRGHFLLFLLSFGITFNELLFPQFYFQGIERMKYITILNVIIKSVFVVLIFIFVNNKNDYIFVPFFMMIGNLIGGLLALYIIFRQNRIMFIIPQFSVIKCYMKDATPVFFTDMICTIKDKFNYFLIGGMLGMSEVSIYDLGSKLMNVLCRFISVIGVAFFPKMAKDRNIRLFMKVGVLVFSITLLSVVLLLLLLPYIVPILYSEQIDLLPIRLYILAPIFVEMSGYISSNLFIALGYNKYVLYSIIFTTAIYLIILGLMVMNGYLYSVTSFVILALFSYLAELLYRIYLATKIIRGKS